MSWVPASTLCCCSGMGSSWPAGTPALSSGLVQAIDRSGEGVGAGAGMTCLRIDGAEPERDLLAVSARLKAEQRGSDEDAISTCA